MIKVMFFVIIFGWSISFSKTFTVKLKSALHIQTLIDKSFSGDTILIPSGEYILNETIHINKGVFISGKNKDSTFLTQSNSKSGNWIFKINNKDSCLVRLSHLFLKGYSPEPSPGMKISYANGQFRIDNCNFYKCSRRAVEITGDIYGVIDHCIFVDNWYTAIVVYGSGETSWKKKNNIGSGYAVFVEDCYFEQKSVPEISMAHHIASNNGSHYVFRYNTIRDGDIASHAIDAHGFKFGGERGSRFYEIYNNVIHVGHRWAGINIRGGDGVIFNNNFTGNITSPVHLMHEGKDGDGNCKYPCDDQIKNLYIWNNKINGNSLLSVKNRHPNIVKLNRDYFLYKKKEYSTYTYPHPFTMLNKERNP